MAGGRRASFNETVEVVRFDADGRTPSPRTPSPMRHCPGGSAQRAPFGTDRRTPDAGEAVQLEVEIAGPRRGKRQSSPAPLKIIRGSRASAALLLRTPLSRQVAWDSASNMSSMPEADGPRTDDSDTDDSDTDEVAEESVFDKAAQMRRIRRSATANHGPGLLPNALQATTMSRILSRRQGAAAMSRVLSDPVASAKRTQPDEASLNSLSLRELPELA